MTDQQMAQPGEFIIEAFELINQHGDSIGIEGVVREFTLNESIYNKFCSATFGMSDGLNFPKNYRLTGQEHVRICIKQLNRDGTEASRTNEFIDKTFRIFKIQKVQQAGATTQNYIIKLCDPRLFAARRNRVSRVFRGSYNAILKKVLIEEAKFEELALDVEGDWSDVFPSRAETGTHWEETEPNTIQFVAPNWTVGSLADYCVNNASIGKDAIYRNGMFFYQTLTGGFRFKSIDSMFADEVEDLVFTQIPRTADEETDIEYKATQILTMSKPQLFDTLQGTIGGAYASKVIAYDPIEQYTEESVYDLEETWNRGADKHLSGHPMIHTDSEQSYTSDAAACLAPGAPPIPDWGDATPPNELHDSFVAYGNKMKHAYDDNDSYSAKDEFTGNGHHDNAKLERRAMLELLNQHRVVVTIPLRTDLAVGRVITLQVPLPEALDMQKSSNTDKLNDGKYLITDIAIKGIPDSHYGTMDLECVKESFAMKISEAKLLEEVAEAQPILAVTDQA